MKIKNLALAATLAIFSFGLVTALPSSQLSNVQAADINFQLNWNDSFSGFDLVFNNPGAGSNVKFKINRYIEAFVDGTLKIYLGNSDVLLPINSSGEASLQLGAFDTAPVLTKRFRIVGNLPADFTIETHVENPQGETISPTLKVDIQTSSDGRVQKQGGNSGHAGSKPGSEAPTPGCGDSNPIGTPDLFQISANGTQATLYWSSTHNSTSYVISYGTRAGVTEYGTELGGSSGGVNTLRINDLSPNTKYFFNVRAQNGCMPGDWSETLAAKTNSRAGINLVNFFKYQ